MQRIPIALLMYSCCLSLMADPIHVDVTNGVTPRSHTPLQVQLDPDRLNGAVQVCVEMDGTMLPGQVSYDKDSHAVVHWIAPSLEANETVRFTLHPGETCHERVFTWIEQPGEFIQLKEGSEPAVSLICLPYDAGDVESTKKPFHHVYAPQRDVLLTKGVGGRFSHHRGIFFGYNRIDLDGENMDIWHARDGEHSAYVTTMESFAGPVVGGHTVLIHWNDKEGEPFAKEMRHLRVYHQPRGQRLIEFTTTLYSEAGTLELTGDRQHAGVQFRAAQEVAEHEETSRYLRPEAWKDLPSDEQINTDEHVDLPWNALQCTVEGQRYTIAYLSAPTNPDGARFSERLYGRFGEFIPTTITEEKPLTLTYRWWITEGDDISREAIQARYLDLANPPSVEVVEGP